jgi:two-component system KDP operon response regulator KdpE
MHKQTILIVDDDPVIVKFVRANLEVNEYTVAVAINGSEALKAVELDPPDLVLLDIMMPEMDGFEVCRRLREWSTVPIIMLTARGDEIDRVRCLELGADDYITKPFGVNEMMARVQAVLRRSTPRNTPFSSKPAFACGGLTINFTDRRVTVDDKEVKLTPTEYNLLRELALNEGKVLTHNQLLQKVWGPEYKSETQYLHVFIRRLRSKLEAGSKAPSCITTIPGVGYKISQKVE